MARPIKKPENDDRRGRVMPTAIMAAIFLTILIPSVSAVATPVPGVQAIVVTGGDPSEVEIKWLVSIDDPDQDVGSYLYNVTIDSGSGWVNLGDATTLNDYAAGGGFQSARVGFAGSSPTVTWNVTVDDGTGPVDSCTVTIDTAVTGDYDLCSTLDFTWTQIHCLGRTGEESTGFDTEANIEFDAADSELNFKVPAFTRNPAYGGKTLGGDTGIYEFEFNIRAGAESGQSRVYGLFSSVNNPVIDGGQGDLQTTGPFRDGISFRLTEQSSSWDLVLYEHSGGTRTPLLSTSISTVDPNTATDGLFTVNQYAGIIQFTLGAETYAVPESELTGTLPTNLYQFWLAATDGPTSFLLPNTYFSRDNNSLCFNTLDAAFGGGNADFTTGGGQPLEDFGGQGGLGGTPQFPGIDVQQFQSDFGLSQIEVAGLFAAVLLVFVAFFGFVLAGTIGAGIGVLVGIAIAGIFNLLPLWILVLVVLLATTTIVVGRRAG